MTSSTATRPHAGDIGEPRRIIRTPPLTPTVPAKPAEQPRPERAPQPA